MKIPPAMKAISAKPEEARALILLTLGFNNSVGQMAEGVNRIAEGVKRLQAALPS
jgi:X-X-X-Leu-X-X-Gly heptad repeat protein